MNFTKINELKPYDLNCNIFDVYSYDGLSMQELLCQFFTKINECVNTSNETIDLAQWLVNEGLKQEVVLKLTNWLNDGTLENLINVTLFENLNKKIDNVSSKLEQITHIDIRQYPRESNEQSDDYRIQRALNSLKDGDTLFFPNGIYVLNNNVKLKSIKCEILGEIGTLFNCDGGGFIQNNHIFTKITNCSFKGRTTPIVFDCLRLEDMNKDFEISNCTFKMNSNVYGINLIYAREGIINNCHFENCNGIYRRNTVNTTVSQCTFKNGYIGIFEEADNSEGQGAYSCGLMCNQITMLGMNTGVKLVEGDHFSIINSMIDYCDKPIEIYGYYGGNISDSYFSSRTVNPTILIRKGLTNNDYTKELFIHNNHILGHSNEDGFSCIDIMNTSHINISDNNITFYKDCGIVYDNTTHMTLNNNNFAPRGSGNYSVKCVGSDDSTNTLLRGRMVNSVYAPYISVNNVIGLNTVVRGSITIPANTPFVVHTLPQELFRTPQFTDITLIVNNQTVNSSVYCTHISKTQITVNLSSNVDKPVTVYYKVDVNR